MMKVWGHRLVAVAIAAAVAACASNNAMRKAEQDGDLLVLDMARELVARSAYDAAIPLLRRAAAKQPRSADVHLLYGIVLRERGVYAPAAAHLKQAIVLAPKNPAAHGALGILLDLIGERAEAQRSHRRAIKLSAGDGRYWNNLGFSLLVEGKIEPAIAALERAVAADPSLAIAYNNLGFAHGSAGHYDVAQRHFRTAGGDRAAKLNLALVYERNGDADTATMLRAEVSE